MTEIQRILRTLKDNEAVIQRGLIHVWEVAAALADIREQKQYIGAGFKTFEEYCQKRWKIGRDYAHKLIEGNKVVNNVVDNLSTIVDKIPVTEAQTRAIREATREPEEQAEVWQQAVEDAGGEQPTALEIKRAAIKVKASRINPPPQEPEPEPEPAKLCDEFGPLSLSLVPLWSTLAEVKETEKVVRDLKKRIKALGKVEVGSRINTTPVDAAIRAIEQALKIGVPFTECFKCQRKLQKDCRLCNGSGWINQSQYSGNRTEGGDRWLKGRD